MKFVAIESQRDSIHQPRVARHELPWVMRQKHFQPQRGYINGPPNRRNPFRVVETLNLCSQGSSCLATLGWMTLPRWGNGMDSICPTA